MHEDAEIVIRDSLNRNVLDEAGGKVLGDSVARLSSRVGKTAEKTLIKPTEKILNKVNNKINSKIGSKAASNAAKDVKAKKGGFWSGLTSGLGIAGVSSLVNMATNAMDTLASQGDSITDTEGKAEKPGDEIRQTV